MSTRTEPGSDDLTLPPPLDLETRARLIAAGVRPPTMSSVRERRGVPMRPLWLAFIFRLLRIRG